MALLERLAILITADAAGAVSEMQKVAGAAEKNLGKAGDEGSKLSTNMTKAGAAMMTAGAGLLAVGVASADTATNLGREVMKLQRYTGMTAEEASKLAYASKISGVPVDSLATGLGKLSKSMEANSPRFDRLGSSASDSDGKLRSMGDVLPDLAEKFKSMPNGPEKTAAALGLFGRAGMDLMPFLNKGRDGIEQLSKQAEKMGLVLSQDNIGQIKAHITSQRELSAAFDGMKTQIGLTIMPLLDGFTNAFKGLPGPIQDVIGPLTVFGGGALVAFGAIGMLVGQLSNLAPAVAGLISWFSALNPMTMVIIGVGVALAAVAAIISVFGDDHSKDVAAVDSWTEAFKLQGKALDDAATKAINAKIKSSDLGDAMRTVGVDMGNYKQAVMDGGTAVKEFAELMKLGHTPEQQAAAMGKLTESQRIYAQSVLDAEANNQIDYKTRQKLLTLLADMNGEMEAGKTDTENLTAATEAMSTKGTDLAIAEQAAADATGNHSEAAKALNSALHAALDPFFGMIDAANRNQKAQTDAAEASAKVATAYGELKTALAGGNEKDIAEKTKALADAQEGYTSAQKAAADSAINYQTSLNTLKGELESGKITYDDAIRKVNEMESKHLISAETANYLRGKLKEVADTAGLIPPTAGVTVTANTQAAIDKLKAFVGLTTQENIGLGDLWNYSANYNGSAMGGRVAPGMAMGGRPGRPHLVGELGPEIFWPDTAGTIINAEKTSAMLAPTASGSTAIYNVTINTVAGDPIALERTVLDALGRAHVRGLTALKP